MRKGFKFVLIILCGCTFLVTLVVLYLFFQKNKVETDHFDIGTWFLEYKVIDTNSAYVKINSSNDLFSRNEIEILQFSFENDDRGLFSEISKKCIENQFSIESCQVNNGEYRTIIVDDISGLIMFSSSYDDKENGIPAFDLRYGIQGFYTNIDGFNTYLNRRTDLRSFVYEIDQDKDKLIIKNENGEFRLSLIESNKRL